MTQITIQKCFSGKSLSRTDDMRRRDKDRDVKVDSERNSTSVALQCRSEPTVILEERKYWRAGI